MNYRKSNSIAFIGLFGSMLLYNLANRFFLLSFSDGYFAATLIFHLLAVGAIFISTRGCGAFNHRIGPFFACALMAFYLVFVCNDIYVMAGSSSFFGQLESGALLCYSIVFSLAAIAWIASLRRSKAMLFWGSGVCLIDMRIDYLIYRSKDIIYYAPSDDYGYYSDYVYDELASISDELDVWNWIVLCVMAVTILVSIIWLNKTRKTRSRKIRPASYIT